MSGFQIPGLGQAKPNEVLPPLPADVLAAAASVGDVDVASIAAATTAADETTPKENAVADTTAGAPEEKPSTDAMNVDEPESPPSLTGALEAAIGGLGTESNAPEQTQPPTGEAELQNDEGEHPEWEIDSSPYESSSSDSSSSDSSDEDSDQEGYELLGAEEMGRLLMEAEGGSDDEGDRGKGTSAAQLRTKNEIAEAILPKPDITITEDMKVEELGSIENIVDSIVLIKAITPGEYQVLDTGSVLCTADRKVVGVVAETIGKVLQPMYTAYFSSAEEIKELGLEVGTKLFYPVDHASYVFTEPLKNLKGSDASNIHDEEVGDDEMEFSDDEKEAEYKKAKKQKHKDKSRGKNGASTGSNGTTRAGPHPLSQEMTVNNDGLNYDDDDGPYKPLTRPPGFGSSSGPVSSETPDSINRAGPRRGGGRGGDSRGRGGGRGRGSGRGGATYGRGGGQYGPQHGGPSRDGYALPPQGMPQPYTAPPPPHTAQTAPLPALPNFGFQFPGWPPNPAGQPQAATATATTHFAPPPPPGWPQSAQAPTQGPSQPATNAFLNPAFMAALMSQMQQQSGQQLWAGQPPPPPPPPPHGGS
ncbi:hypothetical protein E4U55_000709 [Claviceps digitariae]|nr:hypothetical protein E4U55_000709 [Claviceps digitariae]